MTPFCRQLAECDPSSLIQTRQAVAAYFGVPPTKIHPADELERDYRHHTLAPGFHFAVIDHVLHARQLTLGPHHVSPENLRTFRDLANKINELLSTCQLRSAEDLGTR